MLRTKYERQAAIQRLLSKKEETDNNSFTQEFIAENKYSPRIRSVISKENDYDIPAEVILSQTSKAKRNIIDNMGMDTMNRYVY
jgi:hypothetical protein